MEIFGAISAGEQWKSSSDLNNIGNYSSQYHEVDHHDHHFISVDDHLTSDCDVPNYGLEIPFTICHDMALLPLPNSCHSNDSYNYYPHFTPLELCDDRRDEDMFFDQNNNHGWTNQFSLSDQSKSDGENTHLLSGNSKKRFRSTQPLRNNDQDEKTRVKSRKINQRMPPSDNREDALSCTEENNSNASHEDLTSSSSAKGKKRATRGAATDAQSIYARKRREKINERLRVLQNLVPNGTKIDISTMLEEAVQYVKFLQLQIKLLSSDELWMYAPLAYNGMNIGVDYLRHSPKQL